jgi:hypothetical protein
VSIGDRRSGEFRVVATRIAGLQLIVPKLPGYVIRVERSQYPWAYVMFGITAVCVRRPQNSGPVLGSIRRNRQDRTALPRRSGCAGEDLTLRAQQVVGAVERDGAQQIILGPYLDKFLRAAFVVGGLTMHVGIVAQFNYLLHLV